VRASGTHKRPFSHIFYHAFENLGAKYMTGYLENPIKRRTFLKFRRIHSNTHPLLVWPELHCGGARVMPQLAKGIRDSQLFLGLDPGIRGSFGSLDSSWNFPLNFPTFVLRGLPIGPIIAVGKNFLPHPIFDAPNFSQFPENYRVKLAENWGVQKFRGVLQGKAAGIAGSAGKRVTSSFAGIVYVNGSGGVHRPIPPSSPSAGTAP